MRFAIGGGSCRDHKWKCSDPRSHMCKEILTRLEALREMTPKKLLAMPNHFTETKEIDGYEVEYSCWKQVFDSTLTLIVVQGAIATWRWPTYFSEHFVGHVLADGLIIKDGDTVEDAPDDILWHYR